MLKLERIYTKPFDMNGYRIFVDRLWCRGISKANAKLDQWFKEIAPSNDLRKWFQHVDAKYPEFKQKYTAELNQNPKTDDFLRLVKTHLGRGNVILLYGAKNATHNNATVLNDYLSAKLKLDLQPVKTFKAFLYNDGETNRSKSLANDVKYLKNHSSLIKKYHLRCHDDKIYHGDERKSLDHQSLMELVSNFD